IARCPTFGGRAKSFNADKARAVPGVKEVVQIDPIAAGANSAGGVAVVAENTWAAMQGRDALQIEWDLGPNASESSESLSQKFGELIAKPGTVIRNDGDAEGALANATRKVEATYDLPLLAHATMEPMNCTVDVRADSAEAWVPTQGPDWAMSAIAQITKIPREKINVHTTLMGGGFGRRYQADFVVEAAQVSKAIGKPVQVVWTREDDMQHDFYRQATRQSLAAALDDSGKLVAWRHRIVSTSIRAFWDPPDRAKPAQQEVGSAAFIPYSASNYRVEYANPPSGIPVAWWRSVEDSMSGFTVESFVDELAHAAKQDPVEFRLKLIGEPRKEPNVLWPEARALDTVRHATVIRLAAQKSGWGSAMSAGHGRGIAATYAFDTYVAQVAEVSVAADGKVHVDRIVCAVDCGRVINPDQVKAQMESAIIYALSAALHGEITIANGAVQQNNFNDYEVLRMPEAPKIEVFIVPSDADPSGMGEPGVPPTAPAVANAIFAATGKRVRRLPIRASDLSA
ncbi:MAG TPA: molybdopterin cofactor-binding domain-containing protein, partial [Candidatus Acidoferrales bacterium]|nr:molybdopterin cofactor-binding domain-containing protein [Candidatus Acidoferrales bacterium]